MLRQEVLFWAVLASSATAFGAWRAWVAVSKGWGQPGRKRSNPTAAGKTAGRAPKTQPYHRDMQEAEYVQLIPRQEMQQLQALLSAIYEHRGWGSMLSQCAAAWEELVWDACEQEGWEQQFSLSALQPDRLQKLSELIDARLFGGQLQQWLVQQGLTAVRLQPISWSVDNSDWYANFYPEQNAIGLKRYMWAEDRLLVSEQQPANYEGAHCTSRLQVLMHTLAHELVHALVFHRLPHIDAHSQAYLVDERHGPVFRLLSLKVLGHTTEQLSFSRRPM